MPSRYRSRPGRRRRPRAGIGRDRDANKFVVRSKKDDRKRVLGLRVGAEYDVMQQRNVAGFWITTYRDRVGKVTSKINGQGRTLATAREVARQRAMELAR